MKIRVDEKGRIKLPSSLMKRYGIASGDSFSVSEEDGQVILVQERKKDPLFDIPISEIKTWLESEAIDDEMKKRIISGWQEERKACRK